MRWMTRGRRSRFPADMIQRLDVMGRCEMDSAGSGVDPAEVAQTIVQFHAYSQADPGEFLAELRALVVDDSGGFATYGASRLVYEYFGSDARSPDALAILDKAIAFKRERGLSQRHMRGYELSRWAETNPAS
jgi:hypothetical protein